jgi:biotin carboxylase
MRERIIFIESNTSGTGRLFAAAARRLGFEPLLLTDNVLRYPYVQEDSVEVQQSPTQNLGELEQCIEDLSTRCTIAGIYSSSEYFIETASELARRRNLPGADPQAIRICRNKWTQRKCLQKAGVGAPAFARVTSVEEALDALSRIPLPVVLKPTVGSGSVGVLLCRKRSEVEAHARLLLAVRTNERGLPVPAEILVEQYLTWPEYSAETFGFHLLGITRKHVSAAPYFVETGHDFPADITPKIAETMARFVDSALKAVGLGWGPAHTEFRCSEEGAAAMIEINPRLAGGFIPELVRLSTGVDMIENTIRLITNRNPSLVSTRKSNASIRFLCPSSEGRVIGIEGMGEAITAQASVQMYKKIGDNVFLHHDFRDRIGHALACDEDQKTAMNAAESAKDKITVQIQPLKKEASLIAMSD